MKTALAVLVVSASLLVASAAFGSSSATTLKGTVGPGFTISLKKAGKKVKSLKAGTYMFKIADKSSTHNFHLKGPGIDKKTSVGAKANSTWKLKLKAGKIPTTVPLCVPPGASRPQSSCT